MKKWRWGFKTYYRAKEPAAPQFNGPGQPYHASYIHRDLPGAGANQWAWNRLALPTYSPGGLGAPNGLTDPALRGDGGTTEAGQLLPLPDTDLIFNVAQGAVLYMLGDPGTPAGQFVLQPLTNTSEADPAFAIGFGSPGTEGMPAAVD